MCEINATVVVPVDAKTRKARVEWTDWPRMNDQVTSSRRSLRSRAGC